MVHEPSYSKQSQFGYFKDTKHQDASDFGLFFPWLMRKANQCGPQLPATTHNIQDQLIFDFIQNHIQVIPEASEGVSFDYAKHCVFGEQAFSDLFDAMKK